MSNLEELDARIKELEREVERLKTSENLFAVSSTSGDLSTSKGLDIGEIFATHTGDGVKIVKVVHDNLSTYPDAFGYINANRTDPQSGTTGAFDHGCYHDASNYNFMVNYLGNIDFGIMSGGSFRYVLEMAYAVANFNVPISPATFTDAAAPNDSIYYSSTQSKLVYKDGGGTVNNLY